MLTTTAPRAWRLATTPVALAAAFDQLAKEWHDRGGYYSRTDQMAMVPAYQRIIGMGPAVLPLILEDLRRGPAHWFWALEAITGEDPVPAEIKGDIRASAEAWVEWGRKEGLIR